MKKQKTKRTFRIIVEEFISNGIGWIAGLVAADLVSYFFVAKKWWNLGGRLSRKVAVEASTLNIFEWIATAVIGFIVMYLVNKYFANWLLDKIYRDNITYDKE